MNETAELFVTVYAVLTTLALAVAWHRHRERAKQECRLRHATAYVCKKAIEQDGFVYGDDLDAAFDPDREDTPDERHAPTG